MTRRTTTLLLALAWALSPAIGHTAEVGVAGLELIIVDKLASSGRSKVVFVAKDPAVVMMRANRPLDSQAPATSWSWLVPPCDLRGLAGLRAGRPTGRGTRVRVARHGVRWRHLAVEPPECVLPAGSSLNHPDHVASKLGAVAVLAALQGTCGSCESAVRRWPARTSDAGRPSRCRRASEPTMEPSAA
jgi:hypothetical protein